MPERHFYFFGIKHTMSRKLILYIAMSLDGFIAKSDDDISFLSCVEKEGEDYGYGEFIQTIDTVIVGRKTYEKIMTFGFNPHADKQLYVISHTEQKSENNAIFYNGDLEILLKDLKAKAGKNIFCDGGAELVRSMLNKNLIDEMTISIVPYMLGNGIRLFKDTNIEKVLNLKSVKSFEKGLTQLHYVIPK